MRRCAWIGMMALLLGAPVWSQTLPAGARVEKDVVFASREGKQWKLDAYVPAGPDRPVLIRLVSRREELAAPGADLLARGYALIVAAYLPDDAPRQQVFSRFPLDVQVAKAAIRWARGSAAREGFDAQRIALWGVGDGATVAALAAVTSDDRALNGALGEFAGESSAVGALCLLGGTTDWRNAELYGDETVNMPGSPAYQLFAGNTKEHPDDARRASAVNYVRPTCPATLMVTQASDEKRAMHLIFAETLRRAGVASALYEQAASAGPADAARLDRTVVAFFDDTLAAGKEAPPSATPEQQIDQLAAAGLFKQAAQIIDEQLAAIPGNPAESLLQRQPWLKKLRQISDQQQEPAIRQLMDVRKRTPAAGVSPAPRTLWTIREVLTDPERIGRYTVEATVPQRVYDNRADALRYVEVLNGYVAIGNLTAADQQASLMRQMAARGDTDPDTLNDFLTRYTEVRGRSAHFWPPVLKPIPYASNFGQDLYGYWFDFKTGGVTVRMRYVPPGRLVRGSSLDEWGRLPGEPILEPAEIKQAFWLSESVVTQALWEGVMGKDENHSRFKSASEVRLKLPVDNVSYAHAVNFLAKVGLGARLPTAGEWEYACRAGSAYMYAGTGRLSDMGWFWDEAKQAKRDLLTAATTQADTDPEVRILHELETDQSDTARLTHPVKQKLPNRWGLYDMQGNVWEWCSGSSPDKPRDFHPAKGGSWISIPQSCRAAREAWFPTEQQSWNLGFRFCIPAAD